MARRSALRASDADREGIAERLRHATAEGRLLAEELEQRLGAAFSARTYGELDALVADLPDSRPDRRRSARHALRARPLPAVVLVMLIPVAVALVLAAVVVIATLFTTWAILVALAWWLFGHRLAFLGGARTCGRRAGRWHTGRRGALGGFTPWL